MSASPLLARQASPCNLAVIDNHPDWMRGVPFLHCGTWVHHAARLSHVRRIIHIGGDVDFDNLYRFMAPWPALHRGKITVIPARRSFGRGQWRRARPRAPHHCDIGMQSHCRQVPGAATADRRRLEKLASLYFAGQRRSDSGGCPGELGFRSPSIGGRAHHPWRIAGGRRRPSCRHGHRWRLVAGSGPGLVPPVLAPDGTSGGIDRRRRGVESKCADERNT